MIAIFLKYRYLIAIGAILIAFGGVWVYVQHLQATLMSVTSERDQYKLKSEACQNNLEINRKVSDGYLKENINLRKRYDANKLRLSNKCIPISTASGIDETASRGALRGDGVNPHALHDYGRRCGENESQLKYLKEWVSQTSNARYNQ